MGESEVFWLLGLTGLPASAASDCAVPSFPLCLLCKVIFDETLQKCLDSYLSHAPRKFDVLLDCHPEVNDMQKRLHRSVFLTFLRMSTHKESKVNISVLDRHSRLCSLGKKATGEINCDSYLHVLAAFLSLSIFISLLVCVEVITTQS